MSASSRSNALFYAGIGSELARYEIDAEHATMQRRESLRLPVPVMYAWQHADRGHLYVVSSNRGPDAGPSAQREPPAHYLSALAIDRASGALALHGEHVTLARRPIHVSTDASSRHALIAYSEGGISVHRIEPDGAIGAQIEQAGIDAGILPHQIRETPSQRAAIVVARGYDAAEDTPERPGSIRVFDYRDGRLAARQVVAPNGGFGFGPRHLDFHPTRPWVYVSIERQHQVCMFRLEDDLLSPKPVYTVGTLAEPRNVRCRQMAGTIHVHPNGRWVYGAERASGTRPTTQGPVYVGGENSILKYDIDPHSGAPTLGQRIATTGLHPRTFSIDPSGRMFVAANKSPVLAEVDGRLCTIPASLDLFVIADDGNLSLAQNHEVDPGEDSMFWASFVNAPWA